MAVSVTHETEVTAPNDPAKEVSSDAWNAGHTVTGLGTLAEKNTVATADIDNDAVTYAKIQNVSATDKVLGRSTAGAGDVEEIACTSAGRALLDDTDNTAQRTTLGLGDSATKNVGTAAGTVAAGDHTHNGLAPTGGTTGQVLKKVSDTNFDYAWGTDETSEGGAPDGVVPVGGIIMWSGTVATIPTDWALCDGTANSPGPDLRDKFIVGATSDDSGVAKTNLTGSLTQSGAAAASAHGLTTNVAVDAHSLSTNVAVSAHSLSTNVAVSAHTLSTDVALSAHALTTNVAIADHTLVGAAGRTSTASTRSFVTTTGAISHTITQPVVGAHTITQPVVAAHTVTQPVVAAHTVTQPVVSAHAVTQPVVGAHSTLWPVYYALAFIQRMA